MASFVWSNGRLDTIHESFHLLLLAGVFFVASAAEDIQPVAIGVGLGVCVSAVIGILQLAGYQPVYQMITPAGLYLNKDFFGQVAGVSLVLSTGLGLWWLVPGALFGLIATTSRDAWFAAVAGGCVLVWCWLPYWRWRVGFALTMVVAAVVALWLDLHIGLHGVDNQIGGRLSSLNDRLAFWQYTIPNITFLGYGFGTYPLFWQGWLHAHNDFLELAFEIGAGVLPLIGVFIYALGASVSPAAKAALATVLVTALAYFPFHEPTTAFLAALLAGHLCGCRDRLRVAQSARRVARTAGSVSSWPFGTGTLRKAAGSGADLSF